MTMYLMGPSNREPVAAIEETKDGRVLKFFDKYLEKTFEVSGLNLSEGERVIRVFPDGNPQFFLRAFETDGMRGLAGAGYGWLSKEDYENRDNPEHIEKIVQMVLQESKSQKGAELLGANQANK